MTSEQSRNEASEQVPYSESQQPKHARKSSFFVKTRSSLKHQRQVSQHVFGKVRQMAANAENAYQTSEKKRKDSTDSQTSHPTIDLKRNFAIRPQPNEARSKYSAPMLKHSLSVQHVRQASQDPQAVYETIPSAYAGHSRK